MKRQLLFGLLYIILSCSVMGYIDAVWQPGYAIKSGIKIVLFGTIPFFILLKLSSTNFAEMFQLKWTSVWRSALLGIVIYIIIVGGYFALRELIDFSKIGRAHV